MNKNYILLTSESVTEGHPDKMCDMISDAILDAYLREDPSSHVAVETMAAENLVVIAGEVSSKAVVDVKKIARQVICEIGYDSNEKGIDGNTCDMIVNISVQSPDIAQGVSREGERTGAGDQGMMYGYACNDTKGLMPLSIDLAHRLCRRLTQVRKEGKLPYLYPDGKAQVTVAYDCDRKIKGITAIVVSAQHNADVPIRKLRSDIEEFVINAVIPQELVLPECVIHINPTGRFVVGGPTGDVGLTGRKIIVDTYGGIARHGGGAFSGKDPTKVDRSAAYMARYAAKNIVASGLCDQCEINLAYAIGVPDPVSVKIDTFGSEVIPIDILEKVVKDTFDFSVDGIIRTLSLTKVSYKPVAAYGHFGRTDLDLPWERTDVAQTLQDKAAAVVAEQLMRL
ncbi:MAG: methionine adenosyltransferase [Eubacterium sp.]|nr:methionine adenosyltransferase [Eubacterium sp.]